MLSEHPTDAAALGHRSLGQAARFVTLSQLASVEMTDASREAVDASIEFAATVVQTYREPVVDAQL